MSKIPLRNGLGLGYKFFWKVTNLIDKMPYIIRLVYWMMLYDYNRFKHPSGEFTLVGYMDYAKKRKQRLLCINDINKKYNLR